VLRIFFLPSSLFLLLGKKQRKKKKKKMSSSTSSSSQRKEDLANNRERLDRWRKHILLGYYSRANSSREKNAATNDDEDGLKTSSSPLNATRREYEKLRGEFFFSSFSTKTRTTRRRAREGEEEEEEETCSPLSAMKKQNFPLVFQKKELVRVIRQDVERVVFAEEKGFGGKKFWRSPEVRASLIRVLTVFVLGSGDARRREYKQGMHEIAAMVYLATSRAASSSLVADDGVGSGNNDGEREEEDDDEEDEDNEEGEGDYDALLDVPLALAPRDDDENNEEDVEGYEYSQKFIEHDCYALFSAFMNNTRSSLRLLDYFQSQNESFIEEYCERFRRTMHAADEDTAKVFFSKMSLTRLYLPRFLKLAYQREVKRCDFLFMIWDSIIAEMGREGGKESNAGQPSAREIYESIGVAAVLRCKDTITREIALYSNESIGNILNEINAKSFDFSTSSDVEKLIETAKRIAAATKDCEIVSDNDRNENEEEQEQEQQFFDESIFKSNLFSAMEIRTNGLSA